MIKFNEIAECERESYDNLLLDSFEIGDSLIYYEPTIKEHCENLLMRKISNEELEKIIDYLLFNCDDYLEINYGYHTRENRISLASNNEIEIDLQGLHWTDKRRDIVNRNSDIYISDSNLGYITHDSHLDIVICKETIFKALVS